VIRDGRIRQAWSLQVCSVATFHLETSCMYCLWPLPVSGRDYGAISDERLTFPSRARESDTQCADIAILPDDLEEQEETFTVLITAITPDST